MAGGNICLHGSNVVKIAYKLRGNTIIIYDSFQDVPEQETTKFSYNDVDIYIRKKGENERTHKES
jgi:hypothetical protein